MPLLCAMRCFILLFFFCWYAPFFFSFKCYFSIKYSKWNWHFFYLFIFILFFFCVRSFCIRSCGCVLVEWYLGLLLKKKKKRNIHRFWFIWVRVRLPCTDVLIRVMVIYFLSRLGLRQLGKKLCRYCRNFLKYHLSMGQFGRDTNWDHKFCRVD